MATDMAKWLRFQLNDGVVGGKRLVSSAALRETHTPQILMGAGANGREDTDSVKRFSSYAMGWMVEDFTLIDSVIGETRHIEIGRWPLRS